MCVTVRVGVNVRVGVCVGLGGGECGLMYISDDNTS